MATKTQITADQYLEMTFEPDARGVAHIRVIDPNTRRFSSYTEMGLQNVSCLTLPGYPLQLSPSDLFSDL